MFNHMRLLYRKFFPLLGPNPTAKHSDHTCTKTLSRQDWLVLVALGLLAVFIWLRNADWMTSADDTLPILVALPAFYWLGKPWELLDGPAGDLPTKGILLAAALLLIGIVSNLTLLLAIAWTYLLWLWLERRIPISHHSSIHKLLVLPMLSFPWVTLDLQTLGWYFRLSGAYITAQVFHLLGFNVQYEGTNLLVDGLPISVEVACAGLNTLQSMLIAGSTMAYLILGGTNRYWWNLPLLFVMAWLANTVRILMLSSVGLAFGPEFTMGAFHSWGGWFILVLMFLGCWLLFQLQEPKRDAK